MTEINISSGSGGFLGLLTLIFITLKLCGVITWSWLWILSPLWIPLGLMVIVLLILIMIWNL